VKFLSRALQQLTGGIDGAQLRDEVVQVSQLVLRELQFWAHNTVEMATRRKPMILPRFENLEIEWAHPQRPRWTRTRVCKSGVLKVVFILTKNCVEKIPTSKARLLHKLRVLRRLEKVC